MATFLFGGGEGVLAQGPISADRVYLHETHTNLGSGRLRFGFPKRLKVRSYADLHLEEVAWGHQLACGMVLTVLR